MQMVLRVSELAGRSNVTTDLAEVMPRKGVCVAAVPGARAAEQARGHTRSIPKDDDVSRLPLSRTPLAPGLQMFSSRRRRPIWWRGGSENRAAVGHRSRVMVWRSVPNWRARV